MSTPQPNSEHNPSPSDLQQNAWHDRRVKNIIFATALTYTFTWVADFWLATPNVVEQILPTAMTFTSGFSASEAATHASPIWLKIFLGALISSSWLLITHVIRTSCDPSQDIEDEQNLPVDDNLALQRSQRRRRIKMATKMAYMVCSAVMLHLLYSLDVEQARLLQELREMSEIITWDQLGVDLSESTVEFAKTMQSLPSSAMLSPSETLLETSAQNLAKPALIIYSLLWCLHGILIFALPIQSKLTATTSAQAKFDAPLA